MSRTIRRSGFSDVIDGEHDDVPRVSTRERRRNVVLDDRGRLIPDPRPVMAAVAFAPTTSIEERIQMQIANAVARVEERIEAARSSNVKYADRGPGLGSSYDDEDDFSEDDDLDPRYVSPHEFVPDADAGRDVPRALKGAFKRKAVPLQEDLDPKAPKVASGAKDSPSVAGKAPVLTPVLTDDSKLCE